VPLRHPEGVLCQRGAPAPRDSGLCQCSENRIQHRYCSASAFGVLIAIRFDHQTVASAAKMREVGPDRVLAAEFKSGQAFGPELCPQFAFNRRGLAAKVAVFVRGMFDCRKTLESRGAGASR
jgi:hypothetical protein